MTTTTTPAIDLSAMPAEDPKLEQSAMQAVVFEDATSATAKTISRKSDEVRVVFSGNQAKTNGNTIVVPKMGDGNMMKEKHVKTIRGYTDHETGHVLLSDNAIILKAQREHEELVSYMTNAVEDVRIERGYTSLYPGSKESIMQTADYAARTLAASFAENPEALNDPLQSGPVMVTLFGRKRLGMATPAMEWLMEKIPAEHVAKYEKWTDAIMGLQTGCEDGYVNKEVAYEGCRQGFELAKLICGEMKKDAEEEQQQQKGDGDGGDGDENPGNKDQGHQKKDGTQKDKLPGAEERKPMSADLDEAVKDMAKEVNEYAADSESYRPYTKADDLIHSKHGCALVQAGRRCHICAILKDSDIEPYQNVVAKFGSHLATMRRKLERALLSKASVDYESGLPSGKLDTRRLVDVMKGKNNIFRRKEEGADLNTAVSILIDLSGSMGDYGKARVATEAAIALSQPLASVGIPFEVVGFNTSHRFSDENLEAMEKDHDAGLSYSRTNAVDYYEFKVFDERLRDARVPMAAIANCVRGCNHDGEAVLWAAMRLMKRREQKKVLIVMSDGLPSGSSDYDDDHIGQHLRDTAAYLESLRDLHLIGIGIKTDAPKRFYKRHVVLNDISDLSKSVLDQLGQVLISKKFKVDNADLLAGNRGNGRRAA